MTELYDAVLDVVPRLRRYSRLLTGSTDIADDYVQVCLERLLETPRSLDRSTIASDMFRTLHRVIADSEIRLDTTISSKATRLEQELLALPVEQRRAVQLVTIESFSHAEAARISGQRLEIFMECLTAGRAQLRRNLSASVFIIEDELLVALDISQLVEEFGHNVCGTAARSGDAIRGIESCRPSLVLADVQLGDSEAAGIDACEHFRERYDMEVIYVTGYPDRVQRALKRSDVLIVPKPVERETLRQVMGRALGLAAA
jgi:DNA-directed RNA polymerase specialized sigma24 family protein/CheY-like chemotaxis protein